MCTCEVLNNADYTLKTFSSKLSLLYLSKLRAMLQKNKLFKLANSCDPASPPYFSSLKRGKKKNKNKRKQKKKKKLN